jgi:hypothetical protein
MLASVRYLDSKETTTILFVKPTIHGGEALDLLTYWADHHAFPQESTLDQYFDEAQWESYRRLGQHVGDCLFDLAHSGEAKWAPCQLRALG